MKLIRAATIGGLLVYSAVLIGIELATSQAYVRNFFTDIEGPVPFYAVNTTLSVALLWATALLFVILIAWAEGRPELARERWFYFSQAWVFAVLGCDDRFLLHEKLSYRLGIGDHYVLLAIAALELAALWSWRRWRVLEDRAGKRLAVGAALFTAMIVIDGWFPHEMVLRLSLEDLLKTWAGLFFFLFGWQLLMERIRPTPAMPLEGAV